MASSWGEAATRSSERTAVKGMVEICAGIENVFYHMNGKQPFEPPHIEGSETEGEDIDITSITGNEGTQTRSYPSEKWRVVDQSSGGFALVRKEKPDKSVKVGQLVAIAVGEKKDSYILGMVRWLMISKEVHKIGIEKLSRRARIIAVRATEGSAAERKYQPGFLVESRDKVLQIITEKGVYKNGRQLIAYKSDKENHLVADQLIESGVVCEIFSFREA